MSKILLAILTAAAFAYALWLVVFRRELPHPGQATGLRRRLYLATLLFVGLLTTTGSRARQPVPTCYAPPPPPPPKQPAGQQALVDTLRAVWRTLDAKQNDEFRQKLEAAVGQGALRQKTADMLAVAHAELAYHKYRTRGEGARTTCYKPSIMGATLMGSREQAFKQLEVLAKARQAGTIDEQTSLKAQAALAREIDMLYRARFSDPERTGYLIDEYNKKWVSPGASAQTTAALIVQMEGGQLPALPPGQRLMNMHVQINALFRRGPAGNDWHDPALRPGMAYILAEANLLRVEHSLSPTRYDRGAVPVRERSEELVALQKRLLDQHSQTGTLDDQTIKRIRDTQWREQAELVTNREKLTDKDVKAYQEKVTGLVRQLYEAGELPPSFVDDVEQILDCDIVSLKPADALQAEAGFYLRGKLFAKPDRLVLTWLEQRGLIPPAKNHRGEMTGPDVDGRSTSEAQSRMNAVKSALDKDEEVLLPGDDAVRIARITLPQQELDYRLRMRRAVRILLRHGLLDRNYDLQPLQECLGIPIIGTMETGKTGPS